MNDIKTEVLIIGAGLTGLTLAYKLKKEGVGVVLAEKEPRTGGVIRTISEDGFTFEAGPNTGTLSNPELVELFESLGNKCVPVTGRKEANRRLILKGGQWKALPSGALSAVTTPLFSFGDKFRILGEPFRAPGKDPDESVADLVLRRMGRSFLDYAVDPFISGIYAGDPGSLTTRYALPRLWNLEQQYGSFIRGAVAKAREPKSKRDLKATKEIFSVHGGLQHLTDVLTSEILPENIFTGCIPAVTGPDINGFTSVITCNNGRKISISSEKVVVTTGAHSLNELLPFISPELLAPLTSLVYAKVAQVVAGYKKWTGNPVNAFGGLVPSKEDRDVLGILFPSSIFDGRAPSGGALLSIFMGGMRNPSLTGMNDDELKAIALSMVSRTLHPTSPVPDLVHIFRYPHAIPQYEISTGERLKRITELETHYPGLILAGNMRDGIGMADRVKQAVRISEDLIVS